MKLCKDCKYIKDEKSAIWAKCLHPKTNSIDLVTGEITGQYCDFERKWKGLRQFLPPATCGKDGRWFEPRETNNGE